MADDLEVKARITGDASGYINAVNQARAALSAFAAQNQSMISVINATRASANSMIAVKQQLTVASQNSAAATAKTSMSFKAFGHLVKDMLSGNGLPALIGKFTALGAASTGLYKVFQVGRGIMRDVLHDYRKLGEGILGLKHVTGDTTQETSELLYVSAARGVSSLSLQMRIAQMAKHVVDDHKWVRALGVEYKNLNGTVKSTQQIFYEFADALQNVSDTEKREAGAMAVFGRGYKDILPVLALTKQERKEILELGQKSGAIFNDEDLKAYTQFEMSIRVLKASLVALGATISRLVTPYVLGLVQMAQELIATFVHFVKNSPQFATAFKIIALGLLTIYNPIYGIIAVLALLVQNFAFAAEAVEAFFGGLGLVAGTVASAVVVAFQAMTGIVAAFAWGLGKAAAWIGKTFHIGWLKNAGEGVSNFVQEAEAKMTKFALSAPKTGMDYGLKFGKGLTEILKKMKIEKQEVNIGFGEGTGFDPDPNAKGGSGGKRKTKLQQYFENLVKQSREVVETLRDNAIQAKKDMKELADKTAEDFRKAMSLDTVAESLGGTASPTRLIAMFQKRLGQMKNFVANIKTLRALGLPAEMLADLANMGMIDGARLAQSLVSNPSAIPQLREIQGQITAATQEAGVTVSEAVMGQRVMDAIGAAVGAQTRFGDLLGSSGKFGYMPSQADIEMATANITQQVMMSVQSNADPAVIEQAIAWALKTGVPMYRGGGSGGSRRAPSSPLYNDTSGKTWVGGFGPEYGNGGYRPGNQFGSFGPEYGYGGWSTINKNPYEFVPRSPAGMQGLEGSLQPQAPSFDNYNPNNPFGYTQER